MSEADSQRRHYIRFNPEPADLGVLSLKEEDFLHYDNDTYQFNGDHVGLLFDESFQGCSMIVLNKSQKGDYLPIGFRCVIKVGQLSPMRAEVRWREEVAPGILKLGFEYLE